MPGQKTFLQKQNKNGIKKEAKRQKCTRFTQHQIKGRVPFDAFEQRMRIRAARSMHRFRLRDDECTSTRTLVVIRNVRMTLRKSLRTRFVGSFVHSASRLRRLAGDHRHHGRRMFESSGSKRKEYLHFAEYAKLVNFNLTYNPRDYHAKGAYVC